MGESLGPRLVSLISDMLLIEVRKAKTAANVHEDMEIGMPIWSLISQQQTKDTEEEF